ncbi:MAG: TonB-dependent receptor [Prevotella sp.]|nr:TonB-dependent receptor [Prevotella sp.]
MVRILLFTMLALGFSMTVKAQDYVLSGKVVDTDNGHPVEYASILIAESGLWAITDDKGVFTIKHIKQGKTTLTVQCLGYRKQTWPMTIRRNVLDLTLRIQQETLKLEGVTITAKRVQDEATTSYTIDRTTLDNQQILNISDLATLLPGGKTVNASLMNDTRLSLRSGTQEKGNASFGTAIEVDGARLDNNASTDETLAASTRTVSASNIESVEVVTGIPSVEYGDLSNGVVKVNTRKGKSPFIVEGKLNQHTRQIALNKGFDLGGNHGMLNASLEHARSFSDAASPHTAYQRNILSLNYMNTFFKSSTPLTLNVGLTGNIGGYNSEADPDEELDDYTKARDNVLRGNVSMQWLLNKPWLTNLSLSGVFSLTDRKSESYTSTGSASTQPYIHTLEEGYFVAEDYVAGTTVANIVLGPTGYWHVLRYNDSKPTNWSVKLKATQNMRFMVAGKQWLSHLMAGVEYTGSKNRGRGTYYDDMRYAPTWREYRYDRLPAMHNVALYAEEKLSIPTARLSTFELTAGLRDDITLISGSDYGTVSSLSPRVNSRYVFWRRQHKRWVSDLILHAGWGKSVKLPSFQVLYPTPSYADRLAFASTSTADNKSYYAYHTLPSQAEYNPDLKWQYTHQTDVGIEMEIKGTRISLSAFHHKTYNPYMMTDHYRPMSYLYTPPSALDGIGIGVENRRFSIDRQTGIVTVSDATGAVADRQLTGITRRTYAVTDQYVNATPVSRSGLEWIVDFTPIKALRTSLRIDGNYYYYKGLDDVLFADIPLGVNSTMTGNQLYQYVGYYRGSNVTSSSYSASAAISNGSLSKQLNVNATLTTHIPKIRLIVSLRIESSLYNYRRQLSEFSDGTRGIVLDSNSGYFGEPYDGTTEDRFIALYPEYYSTWDRPDQLIPFAEKFLWAKDNDRALYNDLAKLVIRSNYAYVMNPNRLSSYYSANLSVTKEIGDHVSVSFYANNFFNTMRKVHSSQTDLETSLFGSGYVPSYYYGLSLRLKI